MERRTFVKHTGLGLAALSLPGLWSCGNSASNDLIVGHGSHRYKVDLHWGNLDTSKFPVADCHEMVQDSQGRILLLTNHTKNNVLIYNTSGKLLDSWGTQFPGAHGLTLHQEGEQDVLFITDTEKHTVTKTTLNGQVLMELDCPADSEHYTSPEQYKPTETTIDTNGDVWVADGYGQQCILRYSAKGELLQVFGGRGNTPAHLDNAHGICIDRRNPNDPHLLVTDRMRNQLKQYDFDGSYRGSIDLPGAYICRPVIKGEYVYLATIWSGDGESGTGFVSILDKDNRLVSAPGGGQPMYEAGALQSMSQAMELFVHPHDVCVDRNDDLYIPQWNAGGAYPIKLIRI